MKTFNLVIHVFLLVSGVYCLPNRRTMEYPAGVSRPKFVIKNCPKLVEHVEEKIDPETVTIAMKLKELFIDNDISGLLTEMKSGLETDKVTDEEWLESERTSVICTLASGTEHMVREIISGGGRVCKYGPDATTRNDILLCLKQNLDEMEQLGSEVVLFDAVEKLTPSTIRCTYTINRILNGLDRLLAEFTGPIAVTDEDVLELSRLHPHTNLVAYIRKNCPEDGIVPGEWHKQNPGKVDLESVRIQWDKTNFHWVELLRKNLGNGQILDWIDEVWDEIACDLAAVLQFVIRKALYPGGGKALYCEGMDQVGCLQMYLDQATSALEAVQVYSGESVEELIVEGYGVFEALYNIETLLDQILGQSVKVRELVDLLKEFLQ